MGRSKCVLLALDPLDLAVFGLPDMRPALSPYFDFTNRTSHLCLCRLFVISGYKVFDENPSRLLWVVTCSSVGSRLRWVQKLFFPHRVVILRGRGCSRVLHIVQIIFCQAMHRGRDRSSFLDCYGCDLAACAVHNIWLPSVDLLWLILPLWYPMHHFLLAIQSRRTVQLITSLTGCG